MHTKRFQRKKKSANKKKSAASDSDSDSDNDNELRVYKNHIYFWCNVTKKSALELTLKLQQLFHDLSAFSLHGDDITPIYIHLNSYGGDTDAALGVIDSMNSLKKQGANLITVVEGNVSSAASLISVAGSERRMRPNAYMRIHQFSTGIWGKKQDLDDEHHNLEQLESILLDFYKNNTLLNKTQLKKLLAREIDLDLKLCIKHGLVDTPQH